MTARTEVVSNSGTILSLSANLPDTYDSVGYASTDIIWTPVGKIEDHGGHGGTAKITEFTPVDTAVVAKVKGSKNYGSKTLMLGYLPGDAGQVILSAAFESNNHYSAKITYQDGEVQYLDVLVSKNENQDGAVDAVRKVSAIFEICRKPVVVLP